jgi:hypothetical protein
MLEGREIPYDCFVDSLASLREYDTFGFFLAGCHELFALIPQISFLAGQRLREAESGEISDSSMITYQSLLDQIMNCHYDESGTADLQDEQQRDGIGEVYQHALVIYLEAAMAGSDIDEEKFAGKIDERIASIASLVLDRNLATSRFATILLWPLLIAGSCLLDPVLQGFISQGLKTNWISTWTSIRASEMLELMWDEHIRDKRFFGPLGLYLTMEKHGINFCMS